MKLLHLVLYVFFSCVIIMPCLAQNGLTKGASVQNIAVKKLLNSSLELTSFMQVSDKLTIVDFFGTWCVPCLRALPRLAEIKQQFGNDLAIVLVSNEKEAQLQKFISSRKSFSFPVIVDEGNEWNNTFQPPSLPYTVIIKNNKIIDITEAENITNTAVRQWLNLPSDNAVATEVKKESDKLPMSNNQKHLNSFVQLSQDYIYTAKIGEPIDKLSLQLKNLSYVELVTTLSTDDLKKAFWINLYNGYTQAALKANPDQYKNRNAFFREKKLQVAGALYSLDDIEHGILRRSKVKWSLGHFNKLFPSKKEKELRVDNMDYRVHFALNCGAKSCPPIAFYNPDNLDKQLDLATRAYLSGEASYDKANNVLHLPKLMSWFRADFGGKKGMIKLAKKLQLVPEEVHPKIKFNDYDWSLTLNNYKNHE